jgi:hypothetical protein
MSVLIRGKACPSGEDINVGMRESTDVGMAKGMAGRVRGLG